jgi:hypothetical protein
MSDTTRKRRVSILTLVAAFAALLSGARADDRAPHAPPPEPHTACDGRQDGAACSVTAGDLTVQGTCVSAPDGRLACRPGAPPPPPEAITACDAKQAGDGCSVAFGPLTMKGICTAAEDGRVACRPNGPPRP